MAESRMKYQKPSNYSVKTLIGNWFEDTCSYNKHKFNHTSTYYNHFPPKSQAPNDPFYIWDKKFKQEGNGFTPSITKDEFPNYFDNYSTVYDLSYNHFPSWYKGIIYRNFNFRRQKYDPDEEYIKSYGNITKTGLLDFKKENWRFDQQDPRVTVTTEYEDQYTKPSKKSYTYKHSMSQLRNEDTENPRTAQCNPITWECNFEETQPRRCVRLKK